MYVCMCVCMSVFVISPGREGSVLAAGRAVPERWPHRPRDPERGQLLHNVHRHGPAGTHKQGRPVHTGKQFYTGKQVKLLVVTHLPCWNSQTRSSSLYR